MGDETGELTPQYERVMEHYRREKAKHEKRRAREAKAPVRPPPPQAAPPISASPKLLAVLHSINAMGWLILGALMVLLNEPRRLSFGVEVASADQQLGGWIVMFALACKVVAFGVYVRSSR